MIRQGRDATIGIEISLLDHFKAAGAKGHQTPINAVLVSYVRVRKRNSDDETV